MVSKAKKLHWPHPDPAGKGGADEEQLRRFRDVRSTLTERIKELKQLVDLASPV